MTAPSTTGGQTIGLDVDRVTAWMQGLDIGCRPPLSFARLGYGQSNLTFVVTNVDGRRWVLRRPPLGELLASAHDIDREYRILAALEATDVPTPRVLGVTSDPEVCDVPLVLMEYVEGLVVDTMEVAEGISVASRGAIGRGLIEALARIHAVDLDGTGLTSLASHAPYANRQIKRWHLQWQLSRTRDLPEIDGLADRLRAAIPEQREVTLVHGDFHLRNLIVSADDGSVRAVLDWELCTLGEPLADLGGLLAYWPHPDEPAASTLTVPAITGFPRREDLGAAYAARTGRSIDALGFWYALALWKVAIIAEGVLRRAQDDPRNAAAGPSVTRQTVDDLVERALTATEKEEI